MAPVWLWGGSFGTARKAALSEASVRVIVGLQEKWGVGTQGVERGGSSKGGHDENTKSCCLKTEDVIRVTETRRPGQ